MLTAPLWISHSWRVNIIVLVELQHCTQYWAQHSLLPFLLWLVFLHQLLRLISPRKLGVLHTTWHIVVYQGTENVTWLRKSQRIQKVYLFNCSFLLAAKCCFVLFYILNKLLSIHCLHSSQLRITALTRIDHARQVCILFCVKQQYYYRWSDCNVFLTSANNSLNACRRKGKTEQICKDFVMPLTHALNSSFFLRIFLSSASNCSFSREYIAFLLLSPWAISTFGVLLFRWGLVVSDCNNS